MTRHTKPELKENEERIQQAISRDKVRCTHKKAHENEQFLTNAEKQELVRWITDFSIACSAPRHATVRDIYGSTTFPHPQFQKSTSIQSVQCLPQFLRRHSELLVSSVTSNKLNAQLGVKRTNPVSLRKFTTR